MSDKCFFDTNVLFYSFETSDERRSAIALELVTRITAEGRAVISFQVVQEFFNIALKKSVPPLKVTEARYYLHKVLGQMVMVPSSNGLYDRALSVRERYHFSWYDSLIVTAALDADCDVLYTEDLQHGQKIEGLTVVNPFV